MGLTWQSHPSFLIDIIVLSPYSFTETCVGSASDHDHEKITTKLNTLFSPLKKGAKGIFLHAAIEFPLGTSFQRGKSIDYIKLTFEGIRP